MKKDKNKILITILLIITVAAFAVTVWALFLRESTSVMTPDYAPQKEEQFAEDIPNDSDEKLEQPEGGGSVSLTYSKEVSISLKDKTAKLLFANPGKSNQDMVLQIVVQDNVIIQSGTLKPGKQVTTLKLLDGMEKIFKEGAYEGQINVLYYNQETGEKAIVNTEIPVTVNVK